MVDFGCIKRYEAGFVETLRKVFVAHLHDDHQEARDLYHALGVKRLGVSTTFYNDHIRPFAEWIALPFKAGEFDFGSNASYCSDGTKIFKAIIGNKDFGGFSPEILFLDRNFYGFYRIFAKIGAKVKMRNQWIF
jgi:hypothetical protein